MSMANRQLLTKHLQGLPVFEGRYKDLNWLNPIDAAGDKRGFFSLVFSAQDTLENKLVVIKFLDPAFMTNTYRLEAFKREPEILKRLAQQKRCLQLVSPLKEFAFEIKD